MLKYDSSEAKFVSAGNENMYLIYILYIEDVKRLYKIETYLLFTERQHGNRFMSPDTVTTTKTS